MRSDKDNGSGSGLVDAELVSAEDALLLGCNTETSGKTVSVGVLDNGVDVFAWLSWYLLALANTNVGNEATFEVLLEELPDCFLSCCDLLGQNWRNPYGSIQFVLGQVLKLFKRVDVKLFFELLHLGSKLKCKVLAKIVLHQE